MNQEITIPFIALHRRVVKRFIKVFLSGGLAALTVALAQVPALSDFAQLKTWIPVLAIAFISGGVAALEKYFSE